MPNPHESDVIEYDAETETYRADHDWMDSTSLSETVLEAVMAVLGADPGEIEPLYDAVDPDGLDEVLAPKHDGTLRKTGGSVAFTVHRCDVTVYWDGDVVVRPPRENG